MPERAAAAGSTDPSEAERDLARRFLAAVSDGDQEAVGELVHPDVEIRTDRNTHRGRDAAVAWAGKSYDHLTRRFEPLEVFRAHNGLVVRAEMQYVWSESGEVGERSELGIALGVRDGLISSWELLAEIG
jgi:ketosteroid isomerase-like protein